jgi:hypothetical protein
MSFVSAPAAATAWEPMVTAGSTVELAPIQQRSSSMTGRKAIRRTVLSIGPPVTRAGRAACRDCASTT